MMSTSEPPSESVAIFHRDSPADSEFARPKNWLQKKFGKPRIDSISQSEVVVQTGVRWGELIFFYGWSRLACSILYALLAFFLTGVVPNAAFWALVLYLMPIPELLLTRLAPKRSWRLKLDENKFSFEQNSIWGSVQIKDGPLSELPFEYVLSDGDISLETRNRIKRLVARKHNQDEPDE